jgi:hypothetical protein
VAATLASLEVLELHLAHSQSPRRRSV